MVIEKTTQSLIVVLVLIATGLTYLITTQSNENEIFHVPYISPKKSEIPIPYESQIPIPFSEKDQVVPKGASSQSVSSGLKKLNFSTRLPFFDENNVVQSLSFNADKSVKVPIASQGKPSVFLSYRIFGQSKEVIQSAFIEYFKTMGWKIIDTMGSSQSLMFLSQSNQVILVGLIDVAHVQGTNQSAIVAALSTQ